MPLNHSKPEVNRLVSINKSEEGEGKEIRTYRLCEIVRLSLAVPHNGNTTPTTSASPKHSPKRKLTEGNQTSKSHEDKCRDKKSDK